MKNEISTALIAILIVSIITIIVYLTPKGDPNYYDVYVPSADITYSCLERSHNIHSFDCHQPNGEVVTIRGTYIIKR